MYKNLKPVISTTSKKFHYVNHMLSVIDLLLDACPALAQYIINNPSKYYCIIVLLCLIINFVGLV